MNYIFPNNFLWGAASSAPQTEGMSLQGGKAPTIWDYWYSTEPQVFLKMWVLNILLTSIRCMRRIYKI
ncbi:family 1 glycosylhydrolase [Clostridium polynesiense]|uniref:family 1 glycosylhydrolase n=1 Tax=Clostridium polynesiense TaxID=1325933 RepID=UPI00058D3AAB